MWDSIIIALFVFLSAVLAFDSFKKWRSSKKILYLVAILPFLLAAMSAFSIWRDTILFIMGGLILRIIAQNTGDKKVKEIEPSENNDDNLK
jgi:hypothetical protein